MKLANLSGRTVYSFNPEWIVPLLKDHPWGDPVPLYLSDIIGRLGLDKYELSFWRKALEKSKRPIKVYIDQSNIESVAQYLDIPEGETNVLERRLTHVDVTSRLATYSLNKVQSRPRNRIFKWLPSREFEKERRKLNSYSPSESSFGSSNGTSRSSYYR